MQHIDIKIQSLEEFEDGSVLFPELKDKFQADLNPKKMSILEGGMESGKTSIMLFMEDESGNIYTLQMSADMLNTINAAAQGAVQRFGK